MNMVRLRHIKRAVQVDLSVIARRDIDADPVFEQGLLDQLVDFNKRGYNWRFVMAYKDLGVPYPIEGYIRGQYQLNRQYLLIPSSFALTLGSPVPLDTIYIAPDWVGIMKQLRDSGRQIYNGQEGFDDGTIYGFRRGVEGVAR